MGWAKKEDRIDRLATSLCDCTSLFPSTDIRRISDHGHGRDRRQRRKEERRWRKAAGGAALCAAMNYVNRVMRERFPPPVVAIARFMPKMTTAQLQQIVRQ